MSGTTTPFPTKLGVSQLREFKEKHGVLLYKQGRRAFEKQITAKLKGYVVECKAELERKLKLISELIETWEGKEDVLLGSKTTTILIVNADEIHTSHPQWGSYNIRLISEDVISEILLEPDGVAWNQANIRRSFLQCQKFKLLDSSVRVTFGCIKLSHASELIKMSNGRLAVEDDDEAREVHAIDFGLPRNSLLTAPKRVLMGRVRYKSFHDGAQFQGRMRALFPIANSQLQQHVIGEISTEEWSDLITPTKKFSGMKFGLLHGGFSSRFNLASVIRREGGQVVEESFQFAVIPASEINTLTRYEVTKFRRNRVILLAAEELAMGPQLKFLRLPLPFLLDKQPRGDGAQDMGVNYYLHPTLHPVSAANLRKLLLGISASFAVNEEDADWIVTPNYFRLAAYKHAKKAITTNCIGQAAGSHSCGYRFHRPSEGIPCSSVLSRKTVILSCEPELFYYYMESCYSLGAAKVYHPGINNDTGPVITKKNVSQLILISGEGGPKEYLRNLYVEPEFGAQLATYKLELLEYLGVQEIKTLDECTKARYKLDTQTLFRSKDKYNENENECKLSEDDELEPTNEYSTNYEYESHDEETGEEQLAEKESTISSTNSSPTREEKQLNEQNDDFKAPTTSYKSTITSNSSSVIFDRELDINSRHVAKLALTQRFPSAIKGEPITPISQPTSSNSLPLWSQVEQPLARRRDSLFRSLPVPNEASRYEAVKYVYNNGLRGWLEGMLGGLTLTPCSDQSSLLRAIQFHYENREGRTLPPIGAQFSVSQMSKENKSAEVGNYGVSVVASIWELTDNPYSFWEFLMLIFQWIGIKVTKWEADLFVETENGDLAYTGSLTESGLIMDYTWVWVATCEENRWKLPPNALPYLIDYSCTEPAELDGCHVSFCRALKAGTKTNKKRQENRDFSPPLTIVHNHSQDSYSLRTRYRGNESYKNECDLEEIKQALSEYEKRKT